MVVIEACKNLLLGVCDMAIAGGVSLVLPDQIGYVYKEGIILSKDGHCRVFDKDASGTISSSGVGAVLLKRLEDAIRDRDNIVAVIKGYATNNDGDRKTGYTAPSILGQSECILNAQIMAKVKAHEIDYLECHGTATHLGDPIEIQALKEVFEQNSDKESLSKHKCNLGSIKANIGHTGAVAGIAGLIKVCNMLTNNLIPGQANYRVPNPELNIDLTNFEINTKNQSWPITTDKFKLAGISSFGIGGTNAHVIVSDYVKPKNHDNSKRINQIDAKNRQLIFPISAKNRASLDKYKYELIKYIQSNNKPRLFEDIAYTLQFRREHFECRTSIVASNIDELLANLKDNVVVNRAGTAQENKIVFMFPGQGTQYADMGLTLYQGESQFKLIVDNCINIANQYIDCNIYSILFPSLDKGLSDSDINETQWSQIALFIISYSLGKYLDELNIKADAYIGHSIGEFVAATLAGVFNLKDAIKLVLARGRHMQAMENGSMLAIQDNYPALNELIIKFNCEVAAINSPKDFVASGLDIDINRLKIYLENKGILCLKLSTSHAFHSKMMEKAALKFEQEFRKIKLQIPKKQFISNLTGFWAKNQVITPRYWSNQLRNKVEFNKGIETICIDFNNKVLFIEVGVGKGLCSFIKKHNQTNQRNIQLIELIPSKKELEARIWSGIKTKIDIGSILWSRGVDIDFRKI